MTKPTEEAPENGATAPVSSAKTVSTDKSDMATAARKSASKAAWMGTAVGIGSAAIVAALLYANKKRG